VTTDLSPPMATEASEADFDQLYASTFHALTLQLYAYLGDLAEAQDVVQDAFVRAYERWEKISRYDNPVAWVRRVAWNGATSRVRRMRTAIRAAAMLWPEPVPGPDPDRVALTRALAKIPESQRRAVVLHYLGHLTVAEIARQEGVPEGTVKSWLSRGRAALLGHLDGGR
jgi:RNA polymerase sigma-70 factor, ECF subfamily